MANRLPYAAKTLIQELTAAFPGAELSYEPSDPDGYGVYHRIKFSRGHNSEIGPVLELLTDDRISEVTRTRTGVEVGFAGRRVDDRAPFGIQGAMSILASEQPAPAPSATQRADQGPSAPDVPEAADEPQNEAQPQHEVTAGEVTSED